MPSGDPKCETIYDELPYQSISPKSGLHALRSVLMSQREG